MELLIKLYNDKPSRIGIKYPQHSIALRAYEDLITKYSGESFYITTEIRNGKLFLTLKSDQTYGKVFYKEIGFKIEQIAKLQALMHQSLPIEFVHIYPEKNTLLIAKPFGKQQFFVVSGVEMINMEIT